MIMFENFNKSSKEEWVAVLAKELKGADFDSSLIKKDELEELTYPSFFHQDDFQLMNEIPGKFPYKRGFYSELNDWSIVSFIQVSDEKSANEKALSDLMKGNTALSFTFLSTTTIDFTVLLKGIECQYIKVYFELQSEDQFAALSSYFSENLCSEVFIAYNPFKERNELRTTDFIQLKNGILRNFEVDAYSVQQAGSNCSQEVAFALALGHDYLAQQIALGRSVDDALVNIHFTLGVGSNYLMEIAKFRAFRILWSKIARTYQPEHRCNETASVTAKIGFLNKSLKDPYTNLLRQTTEVMSAAMGGASQVFCFPYDTASTKGSSEFSERMATNISLILKEESYLNQVLDAVGGSYAIERLTEMLADKGWTLFQEIEKQGGLKSSDLMQKIEQTAQKRITLYKNKQKTLIGINKFPNTDASDLEWKKNNSTYFGLKALVLENEIN